jgi:cytochrome c peroxidase
MNQELDALERELQAVPGYVEQFREVFGERPSREGVARALAAFQRTLLSGPSPFDRFLAGDEKALSPAARRGWELFQGEADCIRCHNGPLLSDGKFYRLGVEYQDLGRASVTGNRADRHRFRTPSLRNIAETAPYMHDGSMNTLNEVVTFYFRGIPTDAPDDAALDAEPLYDLSFSDISAIVAFLKSLSGQVPPLQAPELPGIAGK